MREALAGELLGAIAEVWHDQILYLVGGAALAMHDLLRRETNDVDLAVQVSIDALLARMEERGWEQDRKEEQRWCSPGGRHIIDLLPFGEPHGTTGRVLWPKTEIVMNVAGYGLLTKNSSHPPELPENMRLADRVALALLKLYAWHDRPSQRARDLGDIGRLLSRYLDPMDDRNFIGPAAERDLYGEDACAFTLGFDLGERIGPLELEDVRAIIAVIRNASSTTSPLSTLSGALEGSLRWNEDVADRLLGLFLEGLGHAPQDHRLR